MELKIRKSILYTIGFLLISIILIYAVEQKVFTDLNLMNNKIYNASQVNTSYLNISGCANNQIWKVSGSSWICSADVDTDTANTTEQIQDAAGALLGGTETLISATYDDANNDIDFVVDSDLHKYSWTNVVDADITNTLTCSDLVAGSSVVADAEVDNAITINGAVWVNSSTGFKANDNTKFYFGTDGDWCMYFDGVSLITSNSC